MQRIYRIHPAIGVARLGNSTDEYFVGPESPRVVPPLVAADAPPDPQATRRDAQGRIKRQGQRFRIFEHTLGDAGDVTGIREITLDDAAITWQVHLANRKAAAVEFNGPARRNPGVPDRELVIDAGNQTVAGASTPPKRLQGSFMSTAVALGDLLTDSQGRLIVLGGFGHSASVPPGAPLDDYANNNSWHDDVSDGPVRATLRLKGASADIEADAAWVVVAPPDYVPEIQNVITLWDIVEDMTVRLRPEPVADETAVSFTRDIAPILRRVSLMHWVSAVSARGHAPGGRGHFLTRIAEFASSAPDKRDIRDRVFRRLRNPLTGKGGNMPKLPAAIADDIAATATLTPLQYARMERWARGEFTADWTGAEPEPVPYDDLPVAERPAAVDRAPLEASVGAGRFPGIEAGNVMLEASTYDPARPFRVSAQLSPGSLTAGMAIPWQADFRDCEFEDEIGMDWWPGQRPCDVLRMVDGQLQRVPWVPQTSEWTEAETRRPAMVQGWSGLGFVLRTDVQGEEQFVEQDRTLPE